MITSRLRGVFVSLVLVILSGVCGYALIEGWSFFDALYMTVITIATVGYGEVRPLTADGRVFTMILIFFGSGTLMYCFSIFTAFIVEGDLTDALRRRKMNKDIARLKNHYIVCGAGSTGNYIIEELSKTGREFVVVDRNPERMKQMCEANILNIQGDASHEAVLEAANIRNATGLFSSLHLDADNLLVVVTARGMNPKLKIIAKSTDEESERKLRQVGADRVVMTNFIGGLRMTSEMIRPKVVTFLDTMLRDKTNIIRVEEIAVSSRSPLVGKKLADTGVMDVEGVSVVALANNSGSYIFNPQKELVLTENDVIIVMGIVEKISELRELNLTV
ncbi:MAG: potassium channel protein [Desulfuromonadaceae bacterium]|nr:potassium channel protein [Desulfuromonadaceae bacterium]